MRHLLALLMAVTTLSARADVVYQWQGNEDLPPFGIGMRLVFTDTAFDDGAVDLTMNANTGRPQLRPDSELLGLFYTVPALGGEERIDFRPASAGLGAFEQLRVHLELDAAGLLSGNIYANNTMLHIAMAGSDGLFKVTSANSDRGMGGAGCEWHQDCNGATGTFQRVQDQPLPEPMTLGLTALGLFGMGYSRRRAARISAATVRSVA